MHTHTAAELFHNGLSGAVKLGKGVTYEDLGWWATCSVSPFLHVWSSPCSTIMAWRAYEGIVSCCRRILILGEGVPAQVRDCQWFRFSILHWMFLGCSGHVFASCMHAIVLLVLSYLCLLLPSIWAVAPSSWIVSCYRRTLITGGGEGGLAQVIDYQQFRFSNLHWMFMGCSGHVFMSCMHVVVLLILSYLC